MKNIFSEKKIIELSLCFMNFDVIFQNNYTKPTIFEIKQYKTYNFQNNCTKPTIFEIKQNKTVDFCRKKSTNRKFGHPVDILLQVCM